MTFSELFTIVVDMLAILVHGTLAGELSDKGEENKKVYQSLIRKLKVSNAVQSNFMPHAGSGVVRIDPLHFVVGCHKRRLNQA